MKRVIVEEVEAFITSSKAYSSISEFVNEAVRLRLETVKAKYCKKEE